jgi:ubiquinone/menaquinone biosynthesis C-methylase UbiE
VIRGYQDRYSSIRPQSVFDSESRIRKAETILAVLKNQLGSIAQMKLLDVGCASGIITHHLSRHFRSTIGIDIDDDAIRYASGRFDRPGLAFFNTDCLQTGFGSSQFDVVVCAHVYEHVPDARRLMAEILRVLRPGGVCYFAAGNRLSVMEPHYRLPFLSWLPPSAADTYLRVTRKGDSYYERHATLWGLKRLTRDFIVIDYTPRLIDDPDAFGLGYLLRKGSLSHHLAKAMLRHFYWLCPTYVWLLKK